jgi:DNA-binding transcriptional regulator YiaG
VGTKKLRGVIPTERLIPFAQILRNIQTSQELTQEELAERFGVTTNDINLFEQNCIVDSEGKRKILRQSCVAVHW